MKTRQIITFALILIVGFSAGYWAGQISKKVTTQHVDLSPDVSQKRLQHSSSVDEIRAGRQTYWCEGDQEMSSVVYIQRVPDHVTIQLPEIPSIELWHDPTDLAEFYFSDDGTYEMYNVPVNGYLMKDGKFLRSSCHVDESKTVNEYGI